MIGWYDFEREVVTGLRDISRQSNQNQNNAIQSSPNTSLFIVAGPGSGKTTVIALRVLKLIFVDDIDPSQILVTTFTRKAAAELRSRILGWGDELRNIFLQLHAYQNIREQLQRIDLNQIITGTLDSIIVDVLTTYRLPGNPQPIVIEDFVAKTLMIRFGLFNHGRFNNSELRNFIININGSAYGLNLGEISSILLEIKDRFYHDQVDVDQFLQNQNDPGAHIACNAIEDYTLELERQDIFDYARLSSEFLSRLINGDLNRFLDGIRFVLVDEYQDTNLIQEQIYFQLAQGIINNGGSITIVGDDDQSLYRFRGATVDLFQNFISRTRDNLNIIPTTVYLSNNYRSTSNVVTFCNDFITLDHTYQSARVSNKPLINPSRSLPFHNFPILGMFRDDVQTLSHNLSQFIHNVTHGNGVQIHDENNNSFTIRINQQNGTAADIALLTGSPKETKSRGRMLLPGLLRNELSLLNPPIQVFNPRGENLGLVDNVQILCGLILECIDPANNVQDDTSLPQDAVIVFDIWRNRARAYINTNPSPTNPRNLNQFVDLWQNRTASRGRTWETEVPILDLVYKLVTWIPEMQNDVENLVCLEAITRAINQTVLFGKFNGKIISGSNNIPLEQASIREAFWNIFTPIATGAIEVEEDLLETLPPDRVNIMSIHQSKGLEFPLVIVDVGSDFRTNHWKQAFKRYPRDGGKTCNMENQLRPYCSLGTPQRRSIDRAFDDLTRQYFEAYSRPQDVLLLVGLNSVRNTIPHVGTGWDRNGAWHWGQGLPNLLHI